MAGGDGEGLGAGREGEEWLDGEEAVDGFGWKDRGGRVGAVLGAVKTGGEGCWGSLIRW